MDSSSKRSKVTRFTAAPTTNPELARLQNTGLVQRRSAELLQTRIVSTDARMQPMFDGRTASHVHNQLTKSVASDLFGNMLVNARSAGQQREQSHAAVRAFNMSEPRTHTMPAPRPGPLPDQMDGAKPARLTVGYSAGTSPHFNPGDTSISMMNHGPKYLDQAAHELRHAYDHIHGDLDLNKPEHRLASELNAFSHQAVVSFETSGKMPSTFKRDSGPGFRSPTEMAESYHGKKGYPGTLDSSLKSGAEWRRKK